jgi:hypothetical protein
MAAVYGCFVGDFCEAETVKPIDDSWLDCITCGGYQEILHPECQGNGCDKCSMGYAGCPDCNKRDVVEAPNANP